jgi:hypothetical protein
MTPEQRAKRDLFGDPNFHMVGVDGPYGLNGRTVYYSELVRRYRDEDESPTQRALNLALCYLGKLEPGDSRAVSDEFVAMFAVSTGDTSPEVLAVIDAALAREAVVNA